MHIFVETGLPFPTTFGRLYVRYAFLRYLNLFYFCLIC